MKANKEISDNQGSDHHEVDTSVNNPQNNLSKKRFFTKGYHPTEPPTFTEEQKQQFAENARFIRTDVENLIFDEKRQMYFFPSNIPNETPPVSITREEDDLEDSGICLLL